MPVLRNMSILPTPRGTSSLGFQNQYLISIFLRKSPSLYVQSKLLKCMKLCRDYYLDMSPFLPSYLQFHFLRYQYGSEPILIELPNRYLLELVLPHRLQLLPILGYDYPPRLILLHYYQYKYISSLGLVC
jgi:hypothetical protein